MTDEAHSVVAYIIHFPLCILLSSFLSNWWFHVPDKTCSDEPASSLICSYQPSAYRQLLLQRFCPISLQTFQSCGGTETFSWFFIIKLDHLHPFFYIITIVFLFNIVILLQLLSLGRLRFALWNNTYSFITTSLFVSYRWASHCITSLVHNFVFSQTHLFLSKVLHIDMERLNRHKVSVPLRY